MITEIKFSQVKHIPTLHPSFAQLNEKISPTHIRPTVSSTKPMARTLCPKLLVLHVLD